MSMDLSKMVKGIGIYFLGNMLNRMGAFFLLPLYTSYLSVMQYGQLEMIYSTNAVLAVMLGVGLSHATLRFYFEHDDEASRGKVIVTNTVFSLVFSAACIFVVGQFTQQISMFLLDQTESAKLIKIALLIIVFELNSEVLYAYIRAKNKPIFFVSISALKLVIQVCMSVYLVKYASMGVEGVLSANLCAICVTWLCLLIYMFQGCGYSINMAMLPPILRYSIPFALSGILGVVMTNFDRYLLKSLSGMEAVGVYGFAMKFALLLNFIIMEPFTRSYGPYRFAIKDNSDAPLINARITLTVFQIACWVTLGISIFIPDVLNLMSGPGYQGAAAITPVLLIGVMSSGMMYCFQTGLLIQKKTGPVMLISAVSGGVMVLLDIWMIPLWGAMGAAVAFLVMNLVRMVLTDIISQRYYPIPHDYTRMLLSTAVLICLLYLGLYTAVRTSYALLHWTILFGAAISYPLILLMITPDLRNFIRTSYFQILGKA